MNRKIKVCICGGGSQGHISAGVIGSRDNYDINILTRRPNDWSHDFVTIDLTGKEYKSHLNIISNNPVDVIPDADIVLVCLPGYAIKEELEKIKPYIKDGSIIGSAFGGSGFFMQIINVFGASIKSFALQRVPYTGRVKEYGHSATLKGYKPYLKVATMNINEPETLLSIIENWYHTPVYHLKHWLEATLSNSNPLLHPCRMRIMFKDWTPDKIYPEIPFMYNTDWNDESSECWVACDNELRKVMDKLPMDAKEVPSVLEYYECRDIPSLTQKMQSIEPFKTVKAHMLESNGGYKLDASIRYFTEDIPYGLMMIKAFAQYIGVSTPRIDDVIYWAQNVMDENYLNNGMITDDAFNGILSYLKPHNIAKVLNY